MREYEFPIEKTLALGIRPSPYTRNTHMLTKCVNLKPCEYGLRPYSVGRAVTEVRLLSKSIVPDFPFPQYFKGKYYSFVVDEDELYQVLTNGSLSPAWTTKNAESETDDKDITAGGTWHYVDLHYIFFLTNGACSVFSYSSGELRYNYTCFTNDTFVVQTACYHQGRVLFGGVSSGDSHTIWGSLGTNAVLWSRIGGGDVLWPFRPSLEDSDLEEFYLRENAWGYMILSTQGPVRCLKPLGKHVIAYCDHGVVALTPYVDPTPTYGETYLLGVGIQGRSAVAGDDFEHTFVDESGYVWRIGADLKLQKLDYHNTFSSLIAKTMVASFDQHNRDVYIGNEDECYVITPNGMGGELWHVPTSLVYEDGVVGIFDDTREDFDSDYFEIATDSTDLGIRGQKTIQSIELGSYNLSELYVAIEYNYDGGDTYTSTGWVECNAEGWAYIPIAGTDFKFLVKGTIDSAVSKLDRINVRYKTTDKRYARSLKIRE